MSNPKYKNVGSPVTRVIEECGELIQALCKVDRFGWFNHHPDRPSSNNMDEVKAEMDDVMEACEKLLIQMHQLKTSHYKHENGSQL